jgi:hypothetical protein
MAAFDMQLLRGFRRIRSWTLGISYLLLGITVLAWLAPVHVGFAILAGVVACGTSIGLGVEGLVALKFLEHDLFPADRRQLAELLEQKQAEVEEVRRKLEGADAKTEPDSSRASHWPDPDPSLISTWRRM